MQFEREFQDKFKKSQKKVFDQYLKNLEKLEELDYYRMKTK